MRRASSLKNVIIYCRESRDDGFENYDRIETQRDILLAFCEKQNLGNVIDIVMDDNKSGTSFERLEPIKEKIKKREVDILLCKDASRLGRNIIESLTFIEFLTDHHVELMFESERYDADMFPLIAWFNERRVKEDSNKIRRVLHHHMESGTMIIKAPYGYIKDGNVLHINQEVAPIIQEIFQLYISGKGMYEIATILNYKGYATPSQLKKQYENTNRTHIWNKQHIGRILNHLIYTGDMPYGQREKVSYKSKKYVVKAKEDWIIIENHHEPIISKEIFEAAQSRMLRVAKTKPRKSQDNTFSGLLYCGRCGARMKRKERVNRNSSYVCSKSDKEGAIKDHIKEGYGCATHRIAEELLYDLVKKYIDKLINDERFRDNILGILDEPVTVKIDIDNQIKLCNHKINELHRKASIIYDDKLNGLLPEFLFKEKIDTINRNLIELEEKIKGYQEDIENLGKKSESKYKLETIILEIKESGLDYHTMSMLFKKILIFNPKDISEEQQQEFSLSVDEYKCLYENGGILFVQNFSYKFTLLDYELA